MAAAGAGWRCVFPFTTHRLPDCPYETDTFFFISELMERMRQGVYEDTEEKSLSGGGDRALVFEMSQRLGDGGKGLMKQAEDVAREATDGDEEWTHDAVRRAACAAMLLDLEFLEVGI
jgi:hypothetical protein